MKVNIHPSWKAVLTKEFDKPYFHQIINHLKTEKENGTTIYPLGGQIFNAFELTPFNEVQVVILGQDPYHNPQQAMGLSFSVPNGLKIPPSLQNIYKELKKDIGLPTSSNGDLTHWAKQGVLMLNAVLTVRANEPASHAKIGWMNFTDEIIKILSLQKKGLVFLLWGKFAQEKIVFIDDINHLVLKAAHPSPFSADKGFFGCKHFSKTNDYLVYHGKQPIDWRV